MPLIRSSAGCTLWKKESLSLGKQKYKLPKLKRKRKKTEKKKINTPEQISKNCEITTKL
jgi:hypothetical protein